MYINLYNASFNILFKIGTSIIELLRHPDLLIPTSSGIGGTRYDEASYIRGTRLAGLVFIYELYKADPISANPFNNIFGR